MVMGTKKPGPNTKKGKWLKGSSSWGIWKCCKHREDSFFDQGFTLWDAFIGIFLTIRVVGNSLNQINNLKQL